MVDATAAVNLADDWTNVSVLVKETSASTGGSVEIPDTDTAVTSTISIDSDLEFIEFVQIDTDFDAAAFRDLEVELVSPSGAVSTLAVALTFSLPDSGVDEAFRFGSARHLGERPAGTWTLRMTDKLSGSDAATLNSWSLTFYGHNSATGTVTMSALEPQAGVRFTASLSDADGSLSEQTWAWDRSSDQSTWTAISGATSATYTPITADVGNFLRAKVTYSDAHGSGKRAQADSTNAVKTAAQPNRAPAFPSSETGQRSVAETAGPNTNIGAPVEATDADGDSLTYVLGGTNKDDFELVGTSGQLKTKADLDYETKSSYTVTVSVHDGKNAGFAPDTTIDATTTVTITVTNVNEVPSFPASATGERAVAENVGAAAAIGLPVAAGDPDGDTLTYTFGGADAASFDLDDDTGQLRTKAALDHESRASYAVTVTATDPSMEAASIAVTIVVTNVDEAGTVSLSAQPQVDTELTASLTDPDGGVTGLTWTWDRSSNGTTWDPISGAMQASYTPDPDDSGFFLRATAAYTDGEGPNKGARSDATERVRAAPPRDTPRRQPPSPVPPPSSGLVAPVDPAPDAPVGVVGMSAAATASELPGNRLQIQRHDIPEAVLELGIGSISADGTDVVMGGVIRDATLGQTYLVVRRASDGRIVRRWVPPDSPLVYQIPWAVVNAQFTVPVGVVGAIPLDDQFPEPNLLVRMFDGDDERIFAYDADLMEWRHVPDIAAFQRLGFYWCNVTAADGAFFDRITPGPPYPGSPTPARGDYPNCLTS